MGLIVCRCPLAEGPLQPGVLLCSSAGQPVHSAWSRPGRVHEHRVGGVPHEPSDADPLNPRGSWFVKNAVGSGHFVMLAQVLQTQFRRGEGTSNWTPHGTSAVVRSIVGLAINCITMLTVDMAFLVKVGRRARHACGPCTANRKMGPTRLLPLHGQSEDGPHTPAALARPTRPSTGAAMVAMANAQFKH